MLLTIAWAVLLVVVAAIRPYRSQLGAYERKRRVQDHDAHAMLDTARETAIIDILSLQKTKQAVLLMLFTVTAISLLGFWSGVLAATLLALLHGSLARLSVFQRLGMKLYDLVEPRLLTVTKNYRKILWWLRWPITEPGEIKLHSKAELEHLISSARGFLSDEEKQQLVSNLSFGQRRVVEVMTPATKVKSVKKSEILGPLVLDELHRSGHSHFPVTKSGDINDIVGLLSLGDIAVLDTTRKHTALAETAMRSPVHFVHEEETLPAALRTFISARQHLLIATNDNDETVGLLSLADVLEALLGRQVG